MDYYSHTIRITNFNFIDIDNVKDILISGYLYSRRNLQEIMHINKNILNAETSLFNGMDYVSLCDLSKKREEYSAYEMYVKRGLSFLLNKRLQVIVPSIVNIRVNSFSFLGDAHMFGLSTRRYSDLYDEVQVKDKVSMDNLVGMSLSVKQMERFRDNNYIIEYLNLLKNVLLKCQKNVPIINLDTEKEILVENCKVKIY